MTLARPTRAACPDIEKIGFNARFHGERARRTPRKSRRPGRAKKQQAQRRPSAANTAPRGVASAQTSGSWLSLESNLNRSARQAFDSTVTRLSRGGGDDDEYDDEAHIPERTKAKRVAARQKWRCAMCNELLTEDFEVDHHQSLQNGGSDDIANLRPLHKRCHLLKNSLEQRRS